MRLSLILPKSLGGDGQKEMQCKRKEKVVKEDDSKEIIESVRSSTDKMRLRQLSITRALHFAIREILGVLQAAGWSVQVTALRRLKKEGE